MRSSARTRTHLLAAGVAACTLALGLWATAPTFATDAPQDNAEGQAALSLSQAHVAAGAQEIPADVAGDYCKTCHSYEDIVAATDDYAGLGADGHGSAFIAQGTGVNPHRAHLTAKLDCVDCHMVEEQQFFVCNDCHYLPLPNGWTDAWDGAGALEVDA